jgi:hypothetical protein
MDEAASSCRCGDMPPVTCRAGGASAVVGGGIGGVWGKIRDKGFKDDWATVF